MPRHPRLVLGVGVVVVLLLAVGSVAYLGIRSAAADQSCAELDAELAHSGFIRWTTPGAGRHVVVVGDSYAAGGGLPDPATQAFPARFARISGDRVDDAGIGSTGYVNAGPCRSGPFSDRLAAVLAEDPDVVIVQGSQNDIGLPGAERRAAVRAVVQRLQDAGVPEIDLVGPTRVPSLPAAGLQAIRRDLRSVAAERRVRFVDPFLWRDITYQGDRTHPDVRGAAAYARHLADALAG